MTVALTPGDFAIKVEIKLNPAEYDESDVGYFKSEVRRQLEALLPESDVMVVAGQEYWFVDNDRHSLRAI